MRAGLEWDDLEQAARVGLVEAARRFRPDRGTAFSTFAVPYMVGEIRRFLQRRHPVAGLRSARELLKQAEQRRTELEAAGAAPLTLAQLATALGVEATELALAVAAVAPPLPLEPSGASGPDEERLAVRLALGRLPPELARIVYLRFFLGLTQQEVARRLGLSQPVVSRRERLALGLLRQQLEGPEAPVQPRTQLPEGPARRPAKAP